MIPAPEAPGGIEITVVPGDGDLTGCHAVRREVFIEEQGIAVEEELDAYDLHAVHLLATGPDGTALGTARFLHGPAADTKYGHAGIDGRVTAVLGRLAVGRAARGTGLGAALVRAVEAEARRTGLAEVYLESQTHALGFYQRLGYAAYGPEFDEGSGIPHRAMRKALTTAPDGSGRT